MLCGYLFVASLTSEVSFDLLQERLGLDTRWQD